MTIEQFRKAKPLVDSMDRIVKRIEDLNMELNAIDRSKGNKVLITNYTGTFELYPNKDPLMKFLQDEASLLVAEKERLAEELAAIG